MGYVPIFDTLITGTLHGRWPDIGLWPVLLSMADRHGNIDVTPQYIASVTGLALDEVIACLGRFSSPDEYSRTETDDGRRLVSIDSERKWGWHVVNHSKYREKARLMSKDSARTASGMDAERKRRAREKAQCPPQSPESPLSDGDGDGDGDIHTPPPARAREAEPTPDDSPTAVPASSSPACTRAGQGAAKLPVGEPAGLNRVAFERWETYLRVEHAKPLAVFSRPAAQRNLVSFGDSTQQAAIVEGCIARRSKSLHAIDQPARLNGHGGTPYVRKTRFEELTGGHSSTAGDGDDTYDV